MDRSYDILLLDDDAVDRLAVRRALGAGLLEHTLTECASVDALRAALAERPFDCLLLDFMLPGIEGQALIAELRRAHPELPIIMLTGQDDRDTAVALMKAGASDFIAKSSANAPLIAQSIRAAVRTMRAEPGRAGGAPRPRPQRAPLPLPGRVHSADGLDPQGRPRRRVREPPLHRVHGSRAARGGGARHHRRHPPGRRAARARALGGGARHEGRLRALPSPALDRDRRLPLAPRARRADGGRRRFLTNALHSSEPGTTVVLEAGQGATFTVTLPQAPPGMVGRHPSGMLPAVDATALERPLSGVHVLLADDDSREMLMHALERSGAHVVGVGSAAECRARYAEREPDALVSDIGMPGEGGYALMADLRGRGARVFAVALTGYAAVEDRERARRAGFDAHFAKPVTIDALVAALVRAQSSPRRTMSSSSSPK